jgi:hypothetical protein
LYDFIAGFVAESETGASAAFADNPPAGLDNRAASLSV